MSTDNKLPTYTRVAITHDGNPWIVATYPERESKNDEYERESVTPSGFFARLFARLFGGNHGC